MKNLTTKSLIIGTGMLLAASPAFAVTINNINLPTSSGAHVLAGTVNEDTALNLGDELTGSGQILAIDNNKSFCGSGSCSLTYEFGGYILQDITSTTADFKGGYANFYANGDMDNPFLTTVADPEPGTANTLEGTLTNGGTEQAQNLAAGLLSVTGGTAADVFNNDSYKNGNGGTSDMLFNTSLSPSGDMTFSGSADAHYIKGTTPNDVPEPSELAMLGMGLVLVGFGAAYRRRNRG